MQQNNPFSFSGYIGISSNTDAPDYLSKPSENRNEQRSFKPTAQSWARWEDPSHGPTIKSEPLENGIKIGAITMTSGGLYTEEVSFRTEVDTLMKAIQAKSCASKQPASSLVPVGPMVRTPRPSLHLHNFLRFLAFRGHSSELLTSVGCNSQQGRKEALSVQI
jgi:hypothetical protein